MQFKREMADLIFQVDELGKPLKWQTRRLGPAKYKVGSRQPVQCGYRDKARGHIIIDVVRKQILAHMTEGEVEAEGKGYFTSFFHYSKYLDKINNQHVDWTSTVTVYEFHSEVTQ